ncbi:MAG: glycosyltransferase family 39 protein [Patescibacteria group bacterium]
MKKIISYGLLIYLLIIVVGYAKANYIHSLKEGALAVVLAVFIFFAAILFWYIRKEHLIRFNPRLRIPPAYLLGGWYVLLVFISAGLLLSYGVRLDLATLTQLVAQSALILTVFLGAIGLWFIAGRTIMAVCRISILDDLGKALCAIVFGQALTIAIVYGAVLSHFVTIWLVLALIGTLLSIGWPHINELVTSLRKLFSTGSRSSRHSPRAFRSLLIASLAVYAIFLFISASSGRPVDTDGIKTYAYIPYQIIQSGGLVRFDYTPLNNGSFASSYLYIPFLLLGPQFLNYLNIIFFLLVIGTIFYFAKKLFSEKVALTACFLFLSMDLVFQLALTTKSDFLLLLFVLWSFILLFRYADEGKSRDVLVSGALFGLAVAVKYNALFIAPGALLWLLVFTKGSLIRRLETALLFSAAAGLAFAPWGIRSFLLFGSPLYPFVPSDILKVMLGITTSSPSISKAFTRELSSYTHMIRSSNSLLQNLWLLAVNESRYAYNKFGPLLFGLLPLVFFVKLSKRMVQLLVVIVPTAVIWYFVAVSQPWYILFIVPFIWIYLAKNLDTFDFPTGKIIVGAVIAMLLVSNIRTHNLHVVTTLFAGEYEPSSIINDERVEKYIRETLAPSEPEYLILPFGKIDTFTIKEHYLHVIDNDFLVYWLPLVDAFREPQAIIAELQKRRVTHIFYDDASMYALEYPVCDKTPCPTIEEYGDSFRDIEPYLELAKVGPTWKLYRVPGP